MAVLYNRCVSVVVFKKDGTRVVFPYEAMDSIVTYNYGDTPPNGGNTTNDGENKVYTVNGVSFTMVAVKGGTFTMGATAEQTGAESNESPTHSYSNTSNTHPVNIVIGTANSIYPTTPTQTISPISPCRGSWAELYFVAANGVRPVRR